MIDLDRSSWRRVRFADMVENVAERAEPTPADTEAYVGLEHLESGRLTIAHWGSRTDLVGTKLRMREGDVLFARRNAYLRRVAVAPHDGLFSAHGMVLRAKPGVVEKRYLAPFMASDVFMDRAVKISVGSLSPTVNWKTLAVQEFDLPPLDQQRRIAELAWSIETARVANTRLVEVLELAVDAVVERYVGKAEASVVELERVADVASGLTVNSRRGELPNRLPYLRVANVFRGFLDLSEVKYIGATDAELEAKRLHPGDVLVVEGHADYRQVGRAALWSGEIEDCLHQNHIFRIRPREGIVPAYLEAVLNSRVGRRYFESRSKSTSGLTTINSRVVKSTPFAVLPVDMQQRLVQRLGEIDALIAGAVQSDVELRRIQESLWCDLWGASA